MTVRDAPALSLSFVAFGAVISKLRSPGCVPFVFEPSTLIGKGKSSETVPTLFLSKPFLTQTISLLSSDTDESEASQLPGSVLRTYPWGKVVFNVILSSPAPAVPFHDQAATSSNISLVLTSKSPE